MQALVVYYSRSGHTKKVAEAIAKELNCDVEELIDTVSRSGPIGWINSGRQASGKQLTKLQPIRKDPSKYDVVIVGTPVWAGTASTPVRTYLVENKEKLKKVAFFCTEGSRGETSTFQAMEEVSGKKPAATVVVKAGQISKGEYGEAVKTFAGQIKA